VPPYRYLLQRRLARAREWLETTNAPIAEIAHALGFTDQSHLTKFFRRGTGMTPGQLRAHSRRRSSAPETYQQRHRDSPRDQATQQLRF
jgi:AraC family transcriptional regulator